MDRLSLEFIIKMGQCKLMFYLFYFLSYASRGNF